MMAAAAAADLEGYNLHQQVLSFFTLCDVTEDDLTQNPQFCRLLATMSQHMDSTGLTAGTKTTLEKAEQKLQCQRRRWLHAESLHTQLCEMTQEQRIRRQQAAVPHDHNMFHETVERCLLVAQCSRQLDPSTTTSPDQPYMLGLNPRQVLDLMPSEKDVQKMKQSLPVELEKHLRKKCFSLLSFYQPEWEKASEGLKNVQLSHLSGLLDNEGKRAASVKERYWENSVLLQRQIHLYLTELMRCVHLLQSFILDHRLKIQSDVDKKKLDYFEGKCELVMQKVRTEMVEIELDTYTADTISAHRKIRDKLESELKICQEQKRSVENKLASFQILGKDFEILAEEYSKLRREIDTKSWALKELR